MKKEIFKMINMINYNFYVILNIYETIEININDLSC